MDAIGISRFPKCCRLRAWERKRWQGLGWGIPGVWAVLGVWEEEEWFSCP